MMSLSYQLEIIWYQVEILISWMYAGSLTKMLRRSASAPLDGPIT
jgi:hypothetical protein